MNCNNPLLISEILPVFFKNTFFYHDSPNCLSCVCKIWEEHSTKMGLKELIQDSEYPLEIRARLLSEVSLCIRFEPDAFTMYRNLEQPNHSMGTAFVKQCGFIYHPGIEQLLQENEYEKAFAICDTPELHAKLQENLIQKVGHKRALHLILLLNEGDSLTESCITYLTIGSQKLALLKQLRNQELPYDQDFAEFLHHPFIASLIHLKEKELDREVFESYIELLILPFGRFWYQIKDLYKVFPDDYSFFTSVEGAATDMFGFVEESLVDLEDRDSLIKYTQTVIDFVQDVPHPEMRKLIAESCLDKFYDGFDDEKGNLLDCWPYLYKLEHTLGCQDVTYDTETFWDRSTEECMMPLLLERSFVQVLESNFRFGQAVANLLEKFPDYLCCKWDELVNELKVQYDQDFIDETFTEVLKLLIKHRKPFHVRNEFISYAPEHLKSHLLQLNSQR